MPSSLFTFCWLDGKYLSKKLAKFFNCALSSGYGVKSKGARKNWERVSKAGNWKKLHRAVDVDGGHSVDWMRTAGR